MTSRVLANGHLGLRCKQRRRRWPLALMLDVATLECFLAIDVNRRFIEMPGVFGDGIGVFGNFFGHGFPR